MFPSELSPTPTPLQTPQAVKQCGADEVVVVETAVSSKEARGQGRGWDKVGRGSGQDLVVPSQAPRETDPLGKYREG